MSENATDSLVEADQTHHLRTLHQPYKLILQLIAIGMSIYQLIVLAVYPVDPFLLRVTHLTFVAVLCLLLKPSRNLSPTSRFSFPDAILAILCVCISVYMFVVFDDIIWRFGVDPILWDVVFGTAAILLVMEITRRSTGWALPIISFLCIIYMFVGPYLPKILRHPGFRYNEVVSFLFSPDGIYGIPLGVSSTYIFIFVVFGAFLKSSGAAGVFTGLALAIAGRARGGPAKVAVIASSLFGTISGAAVANVVTTGSFTIPMMKKTGYKPYFAGAVEAVASTGGQIMPPIMGAGAFVMSEIIGIPYSKIIIAAIIPAVMYYFTNFWMIDFEAVNNNLVGLPSSKLPRLLNVLKTQGYMILPLVLMIFFLVVMNTSVIRAGLWSTLFVFILSWVKKSTRMNIQKILRALNDGAVGMIEISTTCACAGIVIGILSFSGLGLKMANSLILLSGQNLLLLMFLTMIVCLILGMGMPTVGAYVICASVAAPALIKMGVHTLAAHMFVFYFACLSAITPPVCLAAFAGASIAGANVWRVGFTAVKIGIAGFIVPYMFVYDTSLLMMGSWTKIVSATATGCIGCFCLASGFQSRFLKKLRLYQRVLMALAGIMFISPNFATDIMAGCVILIVFITGKLEGHTLKNIVTRIKKSS